ncbi:hypothetical protein AHAS_Ahas05G0182000 [Arachis hypogaea]
MVRIGEEPDVVTYHSMIAAYCFQNQMEEAMKVFVLMVHKGCVPDVYTYNSLIHGWCKIKRINKAIYLLDEMINKGLNLDVVTWNTLIDGFCKAGKPLAAKELFFTMHKFGQYPDLLSCATILDGLFKCHLFSDAISLFSGMEKSNLNLNIETYNVVLRGMCHAGKLNDARELFSCLPAKGLKPDEYTCTIMIQGLCMKGLLIDAEELLMNMEEDGCLPNSCTYNVLVQGLLRRNDVPKSVKYLRIMKGKGYAADARTMELLLNYLSTHNEFWPKAFSFLHSSPIRHQVQKQPSFSSIGITIAPPSLRLLTPPSRSVAAVPLSLLLLAPPVALLLPRRLAPSLCCRRGSSYFGPSPFSLNRAHKNQVSFSKPTSVSIGNPLFQSELSEICCLVAGLSSEIILKLFSREAQDSIDQRIKWRTCSPEIPKNNKVVEVQSQNNILDISSGFLHLAGDSLIPEAISKKCLEDAKVLHQVDKKFIPVVAGGTLAVIDQHAADERIRLEELRQKVLSGEAKGITCLDAEQELVPCILGVNLNDVDILEFLQQALMKNSTDAMKE